MKKLLFVSCLFGTAHLFAQTTGYTIGITLKPYKNQFVYLGYYYGKIKALADSAMLDATSSGTFRGKEKLSGGIYFLVSPRKEILFEILLDKQQSFSIEADTGNLPSSVKFINSAENNLFQAYSKFASANGKIISGYLGELGSAKSKADSNRITEQLRTLNQQLQNYRDSVTAKNPASMLATLFKALKEPIVPPAAKQPGSRYDSTYAYTYFKNHFWDGVSFTDERLLRTPIFELKLDKYYKNLVLPEPDSIKKEVDAMLTRSASSKEMYKYLLTYFVQQYINPSIHGAGRCFCAPL